MASGDDPPDMASRSQSWRYSTAGKTPSALCWRQLQRLLDLPSSDLADAEPVGQPVQPRNAAQQHGDMECRFPGVGRCYDASPYRQA